MILDVTRHKFSEAIVTLLFFAVAISIAAMTLFPDSSAVVPGSEAPLVPYIRSFCADHSLLSPILLGLLYVYMVLRLSRATVRVGLYPNTTLAAIALCSVLLFGALASGDYAMLCVGALLVAEAYGRLLYCFSPSLHAHYLFSAMVAFGALPLVDAAFLPLSILIPIVVVVFRATLRETAITLFGLAAPTFVYSYVMWLLGGDFVQGFVDVWGSLLAPSSLSLVTYLTLPRLVFLGFILFLQLLSVVVYLTTPMSLANGVREVWRVLIISVVILVVSLLLLPAASPSLIVAMVLLAAIMLPILMQYASALNSVLAYLLLVLLTFIPLI